MKKTLMVERKTSAKKLHIFTTWYQEIGISICKNVNYIEDTYIKS